MTRAEFIENLRAAGDTLRSRKIRSALTILGIVIGVTSVIAVASIIDGLNGFIKDRVAKLGSRTLFVSRIPFGTVPGHLSEKIRRRKYLEMDDARYLRESCPSLEYATAFANRINFEEAANHLRYGNEHVERFLLRGVEPQYIDTLPMFAIAEGRFISAYDQEHSRPVIVIGSGIADALFPNADPIGKLARLDGRLYEVIGIFEKDEGLFSAGGVDIFACIPLANFHKNYPEVREFFVAASGREGIEPRIVQDEVSQAMRRRRRVPHNGEDDFEVGDASFLTNLWNQLTAALVLLTGIISSIGLLVGGIGVMNIMLISVTERTAEIGIRKAVGARRADIRIQFLFEAVALSGIGGVIGIIMGAAIAYTVRTLFPSIPAVVSWIWVTLGVAISVGVGLFFGYYPANRAANLDPIVCLRYE